MEPGWTGTTTPATCRCPAKIVFLDTQVCSLLGIEKPYCKKAFYNMEFHNASLFIDGLNAGRTGVQDIVKARNRGSPLVTGKLQLPGNSDGDNP